MPGGDPLRRETCASRTVPQLGPHSRSLPCPLFLRSYFRYPRTFLFKSLRISSSSVAPPFFPQCGTRFSLQSERRGVGCCTSYSPRDCGFSPAPFLSVPVFCSLDDGQSGRGRTHTTAPRSCQTHLVQLGPTCLIQFQSLSNFMSSGPRPDG